MSKNIQNVNKIKCKTWKMPEIYLLKILKGPWQEISIDIIGSLLKSNNKDTIVVIVDQFIKMISPKAITITISSEDIAKIYQNKIWKIHGISHKVLSDRGPQFISKFIEYITRALETKRILSIDTTLK